MSYTTSVLRQITPDQIVKLDFQEALMLAGGLKDLDQQRLTEFSQKIFLLREHVNYLKIKVAEDKKRRIIDFENQLLAELKAKHRQHLPSKAIKQSTSNGTSTEVRESQMEKITQRPQQKVEISKIEKHLQQEEKQQKIKFSPANQRPSFFKWIIRSLISSSQTQKQHEDEEEMLIQEPQIYLHQESQDEKTNNTLSREYLTKKYRDYKSQQQRNNFWKRKEH